MGAVDFTHVSYGESPEKAFSSAVQEALYDHGHSGYSGTIAEKDGFKMQTVPDGVSINDHIERTLEDNDKWGPAFCIKSKDVFNKYIFYGFASC